MTDKERKVLDKEIQYLCKHFIDRVQAIRDYTNINPDYTVLKEVETIEYLYKSILEERKHDGTYFCVGTSGWNVVYLRNKKTYKKGEKFWIKIYHSFVFTDNFD